MVIGLGLVIAPAKTLVDGTSKAFNVLSTDYVHDARMTSNVSCVFNSACPHWSKTPVPNQNSVVFYIGRFSDAASTGRLQVDLESIVLNIGMVESKSGVGMPASPVSKKWKFTAVAPKDVDHARTTSEVSRGNKGPSSSPVASSTNDYCDLALSSTATHPSLPSASHSITPMDDSPAKNVAAASVTRDHNMMYSVQSIDRPSIFCPYDLVSGISSLRMQIIMKCLFSNVVVPDHTIVFIAGKAFLPSAAVCEQALLNSYMVPFVIGLSRVTSSFAAATDGHNSLASVTCSEYVWDGKMSSKLMCSFNDDLLPGYCISSFPCNSLIQFFGSIKDVASSGGMTVNMLTMYQVWENARVPQMQTRMEVEHVIEDEDIDSTSKDKTCFFLP
ncbi:hypothetical protein EDC04DRAFT_2612443 [Pisolithus marmoratus]|nr:hypothetical protein EDC04DRAFT_2612443 [Pisolithus marmoratus]